MTSNFDPADYVWRCDNCNANFDEQDGFDPYCGQWTCTECGQINYIDEDEVLVKEIGEGILTSECPICGGTMERTGEGFEPWICTSCNVTAYEDEYGRPVVDEEKYEEGDVGCDACGNPAYPECKASCPMFDD